MTWVESASCRQVGTPDLWYTRDPEKQAAAIRTCQRCPVRHPCLLAGLHDEHGVWGGLTPEQRHTIRTTLPADPRARAALIHHYATRQEPQP